jgi:hypothetical protein
MSHGKAVNDAAAFSLSYPDHDPGGAIGLCEEFQMSMQTGLVAQRRLIGDSSKIPVLIADGNATGEEASMDIKGSLDS